MCRTAAAKPPTRWVPCSILIAGGRRHSEESGMTKITNLVKLNIDAPRIDYIRDNLERGLIEPDPDAPGLYRLTPAGKAHFERWGTARVHVIVKADDELELTPVRCST